MKLPTSLGLMRSNGLLRKIKRFLRNKEYEIGDDKFIRRKQNFDEAIPDDIEDILEISALLEVKEYDIFGLAYAWWFGRDPNSEVLESHFARYMFKEIVPHWVRHYNRMVLQMSQEGTLNKEELGIDKLPDATPHSIRQGIRYSVILFLIMFLLVVITQLAYRVLELQCFFPPCY